MTRRQGSSAPSPSHRLGRLVAVLALAAMATVAAAGSAGAHVLIESATPNGDGTTTITFTFDHGCEGHPTSRLEVALPEGVTATRTVDPAGWRSVLSGRSVTWEGEPVDDGEKKQFGLVTTVTGEIGQSFSFPTVQRCHGGRSYSWTDAATGSNTPVPSFVATAATLSARSPHADVPASTGSGGASLTQALAAVAILTGLAYAGMSIRSRRRPFPTGRPDHGDRHPPRHTE